MKKLLSIFLISICSFGFSQTSSTNIFFGVDSDIMRINDIVKLQKYLQEKNKIVLIGHADKSGNAEYNMDLSKRRVENVKAFLISKGYPKENISTDYKGEELAGSKEQFFNRRVEIIYSNSLSKVNTFEDFKKSLKPEKQIFWITTSGDTTIEGKKGTRITLATSTMVKSNRTTPDGQVRIELTEYTSNSDYFSDDLYTQSGKELIETNGMIKIEAFQGENKLEMKSGKMIEIGFPKNSSKTFTNFNGTRLENGSMDWKNTPISMDFNIQLAGSDKVELTLGAGDVGRTYPYELFKYGDTLGLEEYFKEQEKIEENKSAYYDIIESNKLDYINCDRFLRDNNEQLFMTQFEITLANPELNFVAANVVFLDINSIIKLDGDATDLDKKFFDMAIPDKVSVTILAIAQNEKTKEVFFFHENLKLEGDYIKTVTLEKSSFEEIKKFLD